MKRMMIISFFFTILASSAFCQPGNWINVNNSFPLLGSGWAVSGDPQFQIDKFNNLYLVLELYKSSTNEQEIRVFKSVSGSWQIVGSPITNGDGAYTPHLSFDNSGVPYMAHSYSWHVGGAYYNLGLAVVKYNGTNWQTVGQVTTGTTYPRGIFAQVAFDNVNTPIISFQSEIGGGLYDCHVMKFTGSAWQSLGAVTVAPVIKFLSIFSSATGDIYIGYKDYSSGGKATVLKYYPGSDSWLPVGIAGFSSGKVSLLKFSIEGSSLYAAYLDSSIANRLTVMKFNAGSWAVVGASGISTGQVNFPSIDVNAANVPYVSYYDQGFSGNLSVKSFNGTTWIDAGSNLNHSAPSSFQYNPFVLKLDNTDIPHLLTRSNIDFSIPLIKFIACNTPATPSATGLSICSGASASLSATGTGTLGWYSTAVGGTYLGGGSNYVTPPLTVSTTYYVQDSMCAASTRTAVTVTIIPLPASTLSSSGTCTGSVLSITPSVDIAQIKWLLNGTVVQTVNATPSATSGITVAGGNGAGNGANQLNSPFGLFLTGPDLFIADRANHRIQKWVLGASSGTTVAGGNGYGSTSNKLGNPYGVVVSQEGDIYIADSDNQRVQKWINSSNGITVCGGNGAGAGANQFNANFALWRDPSGNIYVSDYSNNRVQKWAPGATSGVTVAGGNGPGSGANQLFAPVGIFVDGSSNLFVADAGNNRIQKWATGATTGITVAGGNGSGNAANQFDYCPGVYVAANGDIFVSDYNNHRVQKWKSGAVSGITVAGGNGAGAAANQLNVPESVVTDANNNLYVVDQNNHRIQKWNASTILNTYTTPLPGVYSAQVTFNNGCILNTNSVTQYSQPVASSSAGNITCNGGTTTVIVSATGGTAPYNGTGTFIVSAGPYSYTVTDANGCTSTTTGSISQPPLQLQASSSAGNILCNGGTATVIVSATGGTAPYSGIGTFTVSAGPYSYTVTDINGCTSTTSGNISQPSQNISVSLSGIACTGNPLTANIIGGPAYSIVWKNGSTIVQTSNPVYTPNATTIAGGNGVGPGLNQLNGPWYPFIDKNGALYVSDGLNHRVLKYNAGSSTGAVVAGGNGAGSGLNQLSVCRQIVVDNNGNIYIADGANHRVVKWATGSTSGVIVAGGNGVGSALNQTYAPAGLVIDNGGNLYVAEEGNNRVTRWAPGATSGVVVAGGNGNGAGLNQLWTPVTLRMDNAGYLYIADITNRRIIKWLPGAATGVVVAGGNGQGGLANQLNRPYGLDLDRNGNMYICDQDNYRVQYWPAGATSGITIAGGNGPGNAANQFNGSGLLVDSVGNVIIADYDNNRIQKFSFSVANTYTALTAGNYTATANAYWGCSVTSATLTVNPIPSITISAGTSTICAGTTVNFTAAIVNGGTTPAYQWKKNGNAVGNNGNTYTDNTLQNNDVILCELTSNSSCSTGVVQSNTISVAVNPLVTVSVSITSPTGNLVCAGVAKTFNAVPQNGGPNPVYIWKKNGTTVGANSSTYTDNALANNDVIEVTMTSSVNCPANPTAVAVFTVTMAPVIITHHADVIVNNNAGSCGAVVNYTAAVVTGYPTPTVTYSNNSGTFFPKGTTNVTVTASNACETKTDVFTVTVNDVEAPVFTNRPRDTILFAGTGECGALFNFNLPQAFDNCTDSVYHSQTFVYTGGAQTFIIPANVGLVNVSLKGADGGYVHNYIGGGTSNYGGAGGFASGRLYVTAGQVLSIYVGGSGSSSVGNTIFNVPGGFNGGGNAWGNSAGYAGRGSGGGASDIRVGGVSLAHRAIVAAGGGGGGGYIDQGIYLTPVAGGGGGGLIGSSGYDYWYGTYLGGGGTQNNGGAANVPTGSSGTLGQGGSYINTSNYVAGGGGGYYGGGSGKAGGGGSSYIGGVNNGITYNGSSGFSNNQNGNVQINYYVVNRPPVIQNAGLSSGSVYPLGVTTNSFSTTDINGNVSTASFTVTVIDTTPPGIVCPSNITVTNGNGVCYATAINLGTPVTSDNCTISSVTNNAPAQFPIGTTNVVWTVTDASGNTNTCNQSVTVNPIIPSVSIVANTNLICSGLPVTFTATVINGGTTSCQWKKNGVNVGTNSSSYTSALNHADNVWCEIVSSIACPANSLAISNIYIAQVSPSPVISVTGSCTNSPITATISGSPAYSISWQNNGTTVQTYNANYLGNATATVAGGNGAGTGLNQLNQPWFSAMDNQGALYVLERGNNRVTKFIAGSTTGTIVAGGNGAGGALNQLNDPRQIYIDALNNLFICDMGNNRVVKWGPGASFGVVVAGGNGAGNALNQLYAPSGIAFDVSANMYVSEEGNLRVMKWAPGATSGVNVASGGNLGRPFCMKMDASGYLYISDIANHKVIKWLPGASSGTVVASGLSEGPWGIELDKYNNLYVSDNGTNRVLFWATGSSVATTVAGGNGAGNGANQIYPHGLMLDANGYLIICDFTIHRVQKFTAQVPNGYLPTLPGNYTATATSYTGCSVVSSPVIISETLTPTIAISASATTICSGTVVTFTANTINGGIPSYQWKKNAVNVGSNTNSYSDAALLNGDIITCVLTSSLTCLTSLIATSNSIAMSVNGTAVLTSNGTCPGALLTLNTAPDIPARINWQLNGITVQTVFPTWSANGALVAGGTSGAALNQFNGPTGIFVDAGNNIYITDRGNHRVVKWSPGATSGVIVAGGNGAGSGLNQLNTPLASYVDQSGNIYVSEYSNNRVTKWIPGATTGIIVAGGNGAGNGASQLNGPHTVFLDNSGNVYVADQGNHRVQRWAPGVSTGITIAGGNGTGSGANQISSPQGIFVDGQQNIYITDLGNRRIQKWAPGALSGSTVAGGNGNGSSQNQLNTPIGVWVDKTGVVYVADYGNLRIQRWLPGAITGTTVAGGNGNGSALNQLRGPLGVCVNAEGSLFTLEEFNNRVLKFAPQIFNQFVATSNGTYTAEISTFKGCTSTSQVVEIGGNINLSLKLLLQGYYNSSGLMQPVLNNQLIPLSSSAQTDTVIIELREPVTFALVDSKKALLLTNGLVSVSFSQCARDYFVAVKHRNTVETWTTLPISISLITPLYDFTTDANKAYESNQVEVEPGIWAFYTGDLNQDDFIDGNDFPQYDFESASGGLYDAMYTATDMNGDGFVDGNDFPVYDLNSSKGVSAIHP